MERKVFDMNQCEFFREFNIGNAIKCVVRHKEKGGKQDLLDALQYLDKLANKAVNKKLSINMSEAYARKLAPSQKDHNILEIVYCILRGNYLTASRRIKREIDVEYWDEWSC